MRYQTDVPRTKDATNPIIFFPYSSIPVLYISTIENKPNIADGKRVENSFMPKSLYEIAISQNPIGG